MRKFAVAATVLSLSALVSSQAFALSHGSGSKTFFHRESAKTAPQAEEAPAAPQMHKSRKHKS